MKTRAKKAIPILLCAAMLLTLGCGWDSTPTYVIATPTPDATVNARWTEPPAPDMTPTDETPTPDATQSDETPDANATADAQATPKPGETTNPSVTPTPDPYLIGRWEFKRARYKGKEGPASDMNVVIRVRLFDNGSAEINMYEKSTTVDPPQDTQGVQWRIVGSTLTLTLYGETMLTLVYDGTYLTYEQKDVFGDTCDLILEKVGN